LRVKAPFLRIQSATVSVEYGDSGYQKSHQRSLRMR
jgi:hypothetical protein